MPKAKKDSDAVSENAITDPVIQRLDTLIGLMIPPFSRFDDVGAGLQRKVLELCDYEHTTPDIQKAVGKSLSHVKKELSILRSRGLVKTVRRGEKTVHLRMTP